MNVIDIGTLTIGFGILVVLTNALTELFKVMFAKIPVQITATIIALILTLCAVCAYISINGIALEWYIVIGAVIAGFFVSYTAQFGYDKLNEIIKLIGGRKKE